jgi:hypothetical protein
VWAIFILSFARLELAISLVQIPRTFVLLVESFYYIFMTTMEVSPSKKRLALITIWGMSNIQQKMLGGCFEGYIASKYG